MGAGVVYGAVQMGSVFLIGRAVGCLVFCLQLASDLLRGPGK